LGNSTIKRLLVPLDGSPMSESVLPVVAQFAGKIHASVTMIHVIETKPPERIHGQRHLINAKQAEEYLLAISSSSIFSGIEVHFHIHEAGVRDVSQSIHDHTEELQQDLVVMCTHGSSGLRGMLFGSIAQQVISLGKMPVLLVNPTAEDLKFNFENFLVALDGNPDHERSLDYASTLASLCKAKIHLLIAIPRHVSMSGELTPANRYLPGTTARMMDMLVPDAREYLNRLQTKIELRGIAVDIRTARNNPEIAIPRTAKTVKADLIALATHGKRGTAAFWNGSVTPKISKSSKIPLLLVPVKE